MKPSNSQSFFFSLWALMLIFGSSPFVNHKWLTNRLFFEIKKDAPDHFTNSSLITGRAADSLVLVNIYNSTGGENWTNNTNWLSANPIDTWHGVSLQGDSCVRVINLGGNNLVGTIPSEIGNLGGLQELYLFENQLTGSIPDEIGNLSELIHFSFHHNQLSGTIPSSIGNLVKLNTIAGNNNNLQGNIPNEIGNLTALQFFFLDFNDLEGTMPSEIGNLVDLRSLGWGDNNLTGSIPSSIGNLTQLEFLFLFNNNLEGPIPNEIGNLTKVIKLGLNGNQLSGAIPNEMGNMSSLSGLSLDNNQLSGSLPAEMGSLPQLDTAFFDNNNLTGCIPEEWLSLCGGNITMFFNSGLSWGGDFARFCTMESQIGASCDDGNAETSNDTINSECGCGPIMVNACISVDSMALVDLYQAANGGSWTNNSGWLSASSVGNWHGITTDQEGCVTKIELPNNNLTGTLTDSIGNFSMLTNLDLSANNFSGGIPEAIGNLSNLQILSLSSSSFTGNLTDQIGNLSELKNLDLTDNALDGTLPSTLGNLNKILLMNIRNNNFTGTIPSTLGGLDSIQELRLDDNELNGNIPSILGNLTTLIDLDLGGNNLEGSIPSELGNLIQLQRLSLNDNLLTGSIPTSLTNLVNLEYLTFINNQLEGSLIIPTDQFSKLQSMDASDNRFSGLIPEAFNSAPNLEVLALSNNQLEGLVPDLSSTSLRQLKIEDNRFSFEDLTPHITEIEALISGNAQSGDDFFLYSPQQVFYPDTTLTFQEGDTWDLDLGIDPFESQNVYTWFKDNAQLSLENSNTFQISNLQISDAGTYQCFVTNDLAPDLTLFTGNFEIIVGNSCRTRDSLVLIDLYNATNGPGWTVPWDTSRPMDEWFGVYLSDRGCVVNIDLEGGNNLDGILPNSLGNLSELESIRIYGSRSLTGPIPNALGRLSKLSSIWLDSNDHSGDLPDSLSFLSNLRDLHLRGNPQLSGQLPADFANLTNLRSLTLDDTNLQGPIPDEWANLQDLENLLLSGIPFNTDLPAFFANFQQLRTLGLNDCKFTGPFPSYLCNAPNLEFLYLGGNQFTGELPACIFDLPLIQLIVGPNFLTGSIPDRTSTLQEMTLLITRDNTLTGPIPDSFGQLPKLEEVQIQNNEFTSIPAFTSNSLEFLEVSNNRLSFEHILPNVGMALGGNYTPQDSIFKDTLIVSIIGESPSINLGIDQQVATNQYSWSKDGSPYRIIDGDPTLSFPNVQLADAGEYRCVVTNPGAPELSLFSRTISLEVNCSATPNLVAFQEEICAGENYEFAGQMLSESGIYRDTLRGSNGCDSIRELDLNVLPIDEIPQAAAGRDTTICEPDILLTGNLPNGLSGEWTSSSPGVIQSPNAAQTTVNELDPGQNRFTWTIRSSGTCPNESSDEVTITYVDAPPLANDDQGNLSASNTAIEIDVLENDEFERSGTWETSIIQNPGQGTLAALTDGVYEYTPTAPNVLADTFAYRLFSPICPDIYFDEAQVILSGVPRADIRKLAFSPDGDGTNDSFVIPELAESPEEFPANELIIFNRWGEIVYQAKPYSNNWDGTYKATSNPLPAGTYFFRITLKVGDRKIIEGQITLIRSK